MANLAIHLRPRKNSGHKRPIPFSARMGRLVRLRLTVPLLRARHAPEQAARGTMIGLIWAFTPTFGVRMPLVLLTWLVARHLCRWDFSLLLGIAWTWTTNALVTLPVYYGFYVTGQILLGRWHDLGGFNAFQALWAPLHRADPEPILDLLLDWGLVLWLGALPWATLMGWLGYRCSLQLLRRRQPARNLT
jgi:uncharacterized protein (DUF2062 family)